MKRSSIKPIDRDLNNKKTNDLSVKVFDIGKVNMPMMMIDLIERDENKHVNFIRKSDCERILHGLKMSPMSSI